MALTGATLQQQLTVHNIDAMYDRWKCRRLRLTRLAKISSFYRQGAAYRKERLVIFKKDRVGGRAKVTIDEEPVLWQG